MSKLIKYYLLPAIIVLSIAAIVVNVCYRLVKEPVTGEIVTLEKTQQRLEEGR
ncbi:MAG: hypothetical protein ACUZ8A_09945 [Candidatus Bathyanammoxibius sp.]